MLKKILDIFKKSLDILKKYWLGIIFLVLIGVLTTVGELYDFKIMISKKSNYPTPSQKDISGLQKPLEFNSENQGSLKLTPEDLNVDLENLSEDEFSAVRAYLTFKKIKAAFIPSGIPEVYGQELNISFDEVQNAINRVGIMDPTYGAEGKKIALIDLTATELERYKKIGASIACEYCCGVKTLTQKDGTAACGCDHSQMMRGLAAYLIKNHPEFSDEKILGELNKWKITYFPKQMLSAKLAEMAKTGGQEIKEILEEFPEFLPQMVGGC